MTPSTNPESRGWDPVPPQQSSYPPGNHVQQYTLPPRPPNVCQFCWEGPFAMRFGLPCVPLPGGQWDWCGPAELSYWTSMAELQARSKTGCIWCRFLFCATHETPRPPELHELLKVTIWGTAEETFGETGQPYHRLGVDIDDERVFNGVVYTAPDDPAASYIIGRDPILDVGSSRALALAKELLDECVHGHESCNRAASPSPHLPTRLLDCSDLARPRLVPTPNGERGQYIALSYVWGDGSNQTCKTTSSNIHTYEHGIDPSTLPATIRDAVYVTHMLGFRWLWVDSLCIIQDSDDDKQHEVGRMHHVYRHAHLTIIAGGVKKASESFLYMRSAPRRMDLSASSRDHPATRWGYITLPFICPAITSPCPSVGGARNYAAAWDRPQIGTVRLASTREAWRPPDEELGPIATRAWCMQEYLLSPRSLIFTSRTLQFKCLTAQKAIGNAFSCTWDNRRLPDTFFLQSDAPVAQPGSKEWDDVHGSWGLIIDEYSGRTASVESDKLVACAAVAQHFHRILRSDYLAGLWRHTLLTDLRWIAKENDGLWLFRPSAYRAPSWSWAAIEGRLDWLGETCIATHSYVLPALALAEIIDCKVTLKDPALPFGEVTSGCLTLRAVMLPCRRGRAPGRFSLLALADARRMQWGLVIDSSTCDEDTPHSPGPKHSVRVRGRIDCEDDEETERMWAIPLVQDQSRSVYGLILALACATDGSGPGHKKATFRRIGFFWDPSRACSESAVEANWDTLWTPLVEAAQNGQFPLEVEIV